MRGIVTQLTAFDHAVGFESYRVTSHYITSYLSDVGSGVYELASRSNIGSNAQNAQTTGRSQDSRQG